MKNFRKATDQIYAGSAPDLKDLTYLKDILGVLTIVSLDSTVAAKIAPLVKSLGLKHIIIPINPSATNIDSGLKYLIHNIVNILSLNQPVYIHCLHGQDRTGMALAIYRVKKQGMNYIAAINEQKKFGFGNGLSPKVQELYKKILYTLSKKGDIAAVDDAVTLSNKLNNVQTEPFINSFNAPLDSLPADDRKYKLIEYLNKMPNVGNWNNMQPTHGAGFTDNPTSLFVLRNIY
jgi:hypothetical protein